MPGFPIRKSPDQSLVADSPRHIAGSHVLHRLLMPRHPPYALKNLNTQNDQNKSQINNNTHQRPEPPGKKTREIPPAKGIAVHQRCSRPLCSSQKTTGPTTTPTPMRRGRGRGPAVRGHQARARFLRTQQRVQPTTRPTPTFPLPTTLTRKEAGRYLPAHTSGELSSQCSTSMSSHPTDMRRR